jgi:hypothetical protein
MLAQPTRRQHIVPQHYTSTISSPPSSQHLSYQQVPQQFATQQQLFDQKLLNDYLESQQQSYANNINAPTSFMGSAYTDFANPAIRVQQSTPTPQALSNGYPSSMLSNDWSSYGNVQSQSLQTPVQTQNKGHQRAASSSSVGSSGSQYQSAPAANYQYVTTHFGKTARSRLSPATFADISFRSFSNHLPTPSQTPTQDSFMSQTAFNNYSQQNNMDQTMAAHMSMKQALMDQGDDVPDFAHSARQSVSSYDSPATPHTSMDDSEAKPANGETLHKVDSWLFNQFCTYDPFTDTRQQPIVPKFETTTSTTLTRHLRPQYNRRSQQSLLYCRLTAATQQKTCSVRYKQLSTHDHTRPPVRHRVAILHSARGRLTASLATVSTLLCSVRLQLPANRIVRQMQLMQ